MENLTATLQKYGADLDSFRHFDHEDPGLLPYATLLASRTPSDSALRPLFGVYEWQSAPLAFVVSEEALRDEDHFRRIRRCVALRGDAPYLALFRPGHLTIHRVSLDNDGSEASMVRELPSNDTAILFPVLANTRPGSKQDTKWISQIVLKLLRDSICDLLDIGVGDHDAISLTGRALFLRFLGDRNLLPTSLGCHDQILDDAERAAVACEWLDSTFNGDFLPITRGLLKNVSGEVFVSLGNIMRRAPDSQLYLGWEEKWNNLDFAHIPVGVLSEAYEQYMREHDPEKQKKEGSYYTPRTIVDLMIKAAFYGLRDSGRESEARVLDPAAGAGVFLVAAFRELVANRWTKDGKRPDTKVLREILYNQISGFDINEAALRFAALGLYLLSIELDPEPEPVEKLRFPKNLRETVLFYLGDSEDGLGSLGDAVNLHFGVYDLVIGNPPWARSTGLRNWSKLSEIVKNIAKERLPHDTSFQLLPKKVMDLPFVWRAMKWAKPGGIISFALHARLLFLQGDGMVFARSALFRALDVTGILNGAELCQTKVWPGISVPFCLLFAKNQLPGRGAGFRFVSPHREDQLNGVGALRVSQSSAEIVSTSEVANRPEILKILYRGTKLDLAVYDRMVARVMPLEHYWGERFGRQNNRLKQVGNGYQKFRLSSRVRKGEKSDGEPGVSAKYLEDLPELTQAAMKDLLIDPAKLKTFAEKRIHDPRPRTLFRAPLLLVREAPPVASGRIHVALAEEDLVFNQSYHGYSAWGDPDGDKLLRYLVLLISSRPAMWHVLVTSGRFGVERRVVEKITIDSIPVVPIEQLSPELSEEIDGLFNELVLDNSAQNWAKVDVWAAKVYGLRDTEMRVISDTLRFNLPFSKYLNAAQKAPTQHEINAFCKTVQNHLQPWGTREQCSIMVQQIPISPELPWRMVRVIAAATGADEDTFKTLDDWREVIQIADRIAATEVIYPIPESRSLVIARLHQSRYWSESEANLVAREIVWKHLSVLFGEVPE